MEDIIKGMILGLPFLIYGIWDIRKEANKYFKNSLYKYVDKLIFFLISTIFSWIAVIIGLFLIN